MFSYFGRNQFLVRGMSLRSYLCPASWTLDPFTYNLCRHYAWTLLTTGLTNRASCDPNLANRAAPIQHNQHIFHFRSVSVRWMNRHHPLLTCSVSEQVLCRKLWFIRVDILGALKKQKTEAKKAEATPVQDSGSHILVLLFQCKWKTI